MARTFVQLQTTLDDRGRAVELVREAVEARLAACGQVLGPVDSTYWWRGRVESEREWLVVFKTRASLAASLREFILERHPYELPEIVVADVATSKAYGDWIRGETRR